MRDISATERGVADRDAAASRATLIARRDTTNATDASRSVNASNHAEQRPVRRCRSTPTQRGTRGSPTNEPIATRPCRCCTATSLATQLLAQRARLLLRRLEHQRRDELGRIARLGIERERATGGLHRLGAARGLAGCERVARVASSRATMRARRLEVAIAVEEALDALAELARARPLARLAGERGDAQRVELGRRCRDRAGAPRASVGAAERARQRPAPLRCSGSPARISNRIEPSA